MRSLSERSGQRVTGIVAKLKEQQQGQQDHGCLGGEPARLPGVQQGGQQQAGEGRDDHAIVHGPVHLVNQHGRRDQHQQQQAESQDPAGDPARP